ncbi:DUF5808 domain-containing protein [Flavobacterium hungaricum]|uniref:DUF5808 domain-containing protein n=1 Tax=Flavobacterium hungaricum TaxID=2082725 RepID=A0ABR9TPD1_9FLAO|nr:DUF5808 domain-containing protein [Flavobacterium hungaricum]MBE8727201.1 hypothetical protein [Flavobacterium hungaricum]
MEDNREPSEETKEQWHQDPDNWIWGMFYYNPKDARLFPPKKVRELGWTINFANPNSVFIAFVIIGILLIISEKIKLAQ